MQQFNFTKKIFNFIKKRCGYELNVFLTSKYITDGAFFLNKEYVNYEKIETKVVENDNNMNSALNRYIKPTYNKTISECGVERELSLISERIVTIADFKYKLGLKYASGLDNYNAEKCMDMPTYFIADKKYLEVITKKENSYRDEETEYRDVVFGINSLYLNEIVDKLNLTLMEVIEKEECDLSFEHTIQYKCYYRLLNDNKDVVGVIMACESGVYTHDTDRYVVLEPISDDTLDKIIVGKI